MGKILVWVGADVTPTTGHQRFSAGNTIVLVPSQLARSQLLQDEESHLHRDPLSGAGPNLMGVVMCNYAVILFLM